MKKDNSIENAISKVATTVTAIESLRSRLFVKQLPPLYQKHVAKTVFCPPAIWAVVTSDKEYLQKIEKVVLDLADPEPERHIKFFDLDGNELLPAPRDIIALVTMNSARKDDVPEPEKEKE